MKIGRPPGPRAKLRLLGRRNVPQEPPAGPEAPIEPPKGLPAPARRVWQRDAPRVPGRLRLADAGAFELVCRVTALAETLLGRAEVAVAQAEGDRVPQQVWAAAKIVKLASDLRADFGMTPVDRRRLHVEPERGEDALETFRREYPRA
jgi:hypothetical protein